MKGFPYLIFIMLFAGFSSCTSSQDDSEKKFASSSFTVEPVALSSEDKEQLDTATFAGGCFWCTEAVFERVRGVKSVISGYAGGEQPNPTYQQVSAGETDHAEAIQIYYNPQQINYYQLLKVFFGTHDPTQLNRQGPDVGRQYRSAVFYHNAFQQQEAEQYMKKLEKSGKYDKPVVTQLEPYKDFYEAEAYHQNYYENNPDNPYIISVTKPKVVKFEQNFKNLLKEDESS